MRGMLAAVTVTAACVLAPAAASAQEFVDDPYEGFNRRMFAIHEGIDKAVLEPIARGYRAITPSPVRTGVRNFLRNLGAPVIFANDLLQGEADRAGTTFARFTLNSTIGVLGVFDPATDMGYERHDEDFGQTLAIWGTPSGPYLFIPLLGPTNVRDGAGRMVDRVFDPFTWNDADEAFTTTRIVVTGVSARENVLDAIDDVRENSVDPYLTLRNTYGLWRYSAIQNGRRDIQDLPEFEEIPNYDDPALTSPELAPEASPEAAPAEPPSDAPATTSQEGTALDPFADENQSADNYLLSQEIYQ